MSQVNEVAVMENQKPMADRVITVESKLRLCLFVECSRLTYIKHFWLLWLSIFMQWVDWRIDFDQFLFKNVQQFVFYVTVLVKYHCHFVITLV